MSDVVRHDPRSPERKAEMRAALISIEETILGAVRQGLVAARASLTALVADTDPSPAQLQAVVKTLETLHKMARDLCGDPNENQGPTINIQVNNVEADQGLIAAVARAQAEVAAGNLERAQQYLADAETVIDGDIVE